MIQRMRFLLFACALTLGACTTDPAPNHGLAGTSWRFVKIDGLDAVTHGARLEFSDTNLGANVGCNGMGGAWRVKDERLIAGPIVQTQMYCEGAVWDQEKAIGALLAAAPEVEFRDTHLILRSSGHSAELERLDQPPPSQK
jgi:heat shock protein HslJ